MSARLNEDVQVGSARIQKSRFEIGGSILAYYLYGIVESLLDAGELSGDDGSGLGDLDGRFIKSLILTAVMLGLHYFY